MPKQKTAAVRSTRDLPPTTKQIYAIARAALDEAGIRWPGTRREASELIARLREES
jgi:hypothetical protein